ncbi:MAG TPA: FtsX-like permease family protein, partial [Vicinamibacterales bacterium]|nr:FtsX-like permease family protein [Vicinamibacterales bacterium]
LGATRGRLVMQLITESTAIGVLGGLAGLALAEAGVRLFLAYGTIDAPGIDQTRLDWTVVGFAAALSIATGALCGLLPAWRVARARFSSSLSDVRGSSGLDVSRARMWLVAGEMALALPLLVGAALLTQTLVRELSVDPGFDANHALQFRLTLSGPQYDGSAPRAAFFADLTTKLAALPGAEASGIVSSLPLGGLNNTGGSFLYEREDGSIAQIGLGFRAATSGYFTAFGVPLRQGRLFSDAPSDLNTVVINERAAETMWGPGNVVGRRVKFGQAGDPPDKMPWLTIVGVVGDLHHERLTTNPNPEVFQPYSSNTWTTMTVVTRTAGDPAALVAGARRVVHDLDPRLAMVALGPASQYVDHQLSRPRFGVVCATIFGALGLLLAAFGTFAVLSVLVAQRTREIGIRMALGAAPARVRALVVRESLIPAVCGCVVGGVIAAWSARGLSSQLFGVTPGDPATFTIAVAVLLAVAAAASWWPARRAMSVDPVKALRTD